MRRTSTVALGLVAATTMLALALATPVVAERGYLPGWRGDTSTSQATTEQTQSAVESWLDAFGFGNLIVADMVDVDGRIYVVINDEAGNGAFELLVSRNGSWVHPAPTMIWNTGYDLMTAMMAEMPHGGMMKTSGGHQHDQHGSMAGEMMRGHEMTGMMDPAACQSMVVVEAADPLADPLTLDAATAAAQAWLDTNQPGMTVVSPVSFPDYVTVRVSDGSTVTSLIAVQLATGTVWPLDWPVR